MGQRGLANPRLGRRLGLCCLVSVVLAATCSRAPASEGWKLTLVPSTDQALPAEPILVFASLRYEGDDPFVGYASFGRAVLICTDGEGRRSGGPLYALSFGGPQDELPPAGATSYRSGWQRDIWILALYDSEDDRYLLSAPGEVSFQLSAQIWAGAGIETYRPVSVRSDPVAVAVLALPDAEKEASALWCGREQARMLLTGDSVPEAEEKVRRLAEEHPESAYSKHALLALAHAKRATRAGLAAAGPVPAEGQQEHDRLVGEKVALLEQIVEQGEGFHLLPFVLDELLASARFLAEPQRTEKMDRYARMLLAIPEAPEPFRAHAAGALSLSPQR